MRACTCTVLCHVCTRLVSAWFDKQTADSRQQQTRRNMAYRQLSYATTEYRANPNSIWYFHSGKWCPEAHLMTSITRLHKPKQEMTHDRPPAKCRTNQSLFWWWNPCWDIPQRRCTLCPLISGQWQRGHVIHVINLAQLDAPGAPYRFITLSPRLRLLRTNHLYTCKESCIQTQARPRCVWNNFILLRLSHWYPFTLPSCPVFFSDCPTPEARAGICLCWRSSEHTESIRPSWSLSCTGCSHWYFFVSLCVLPYCLDRKCYFIRSFGLVLPRAIRWLEKTTRAHRHTYFIGPSPSGQCFFSPRLLLRIHPIHAVPAEPSLSLLCLTASLPFISYCWPLTVAALYFWFRFSVDSPV